MDTVRGPSPTGMTQRAIQAREVRDLLPSAKTTNLPADGKKAQPSGNSLPQSQANERPEHDTGLARAIERLQANAAKSPEAQGLQQALEKLSARLPAAVDTSA